MKIFLGGFWDPYRARRYKDESIALGKLLAEKKYDLYVGPGSGIVSYVLEGMKQVDDRGKIIFYLPSKKDLVKFGEDIGDFADEVMELDGHYTERIMSIAKETDAYIAIGGAAGTLYEMITMMFFKKPVAMMTDTGSASNAARFLGGLRNYYFEGNTAEELVDYIESASIDTNIPEEGIDWYDEE
ncbi:hypothetical protein KC571_02850 [candidate division WWE3 bacterium]|uniref:TIGR00725 family protein n=1 Tax=candidate division WWE3 bacterium TaxID=2053526 RepID=A0A955LIA2_UNCKA|nr:hypothetical protein [candidate division WWE3 bacterium]